MYIICLEIYVPYKICESIETFWNTCFIYFIYILINITFEQIFEFSYHLLIRVF